MNQQAVPASAAWAEVVRDWCVTDVEALFGLQIFDFTGLHGKLEDLFIGLRDARLVRSQNEIEVMV